jgi:integrase
LYVKGLTPVPLAAAVPGVAGWSRARLPVVIGAVEVRALIGSCDRSRVVGRRDFAILTVLGRLGLRSGEIAGRHRLAGRRARRARQGPPV